MRRTPIPGAVLAVGHLFILPQALGDPGGMGGRSLIPGVFDQDGSRACCYEHNSSGNDGFGFKAYSLFRDKGDGAGDGGIHKMKEIQTVIRDFQAVVTNVVGVLPNLTSRQINGYYIKVLKAALTVPEPGSLLMLAAAVASLALPRRRRAGSLEG